MKTKIINLTGYEWTPEQLHDLNEREISTLKPSQEELNKIKELLNFSSAPSPGEIEARTDRLAEVCKNSGVQFALIAGVAWAAPWLERSLFTRGVTPLYSFSERKMKEILCEDGETKLVPSFQHIKFIKAVNLYV